MFSTNNMENFSSQFSNRKKKVSEKKTELPETASIIFQENEVYPQITIILLYQDKIQKFVFDIDEIEQKVGLAGKIFNWYKNKDNVPK